MSINNTTYKYDFGIAFTEYGLNKISRALRVKKPEMFTRKEDILIKPATGADPAHILTLYAQISKDSLAFDFSPLNDGSAPVDDMLSITGTIDFALTDNVLGFVTRLGIDVTVTAKLARTDSLRIQLTDFKINKIIGLAPNFGGTTTALQIDRTSRIVNGAIDVSARVNQRYSLSASADKQLVDSFNAIVNYLVQLFLKDGLEKVVINFPIPDLQKILTFGKLTFGNGDLRGPFVRNNSFYVQLGNDYASPTAFPGEFTPSLDLRIGLSQSGIRRAINAFLPVPFGHIGNHDYNTFYFYSDDFEIYRIDLTVNPGSLKMPLNVFLKGNFYLGFQVTIPIINTHIQIPLVIPLDRISHYQGHVTAQLLVDSYQNPDSKIHVHLFPDTGMFEAWVIFLVTDYRDYLRQAIKDWVHAHGGGFIVNIFRHIPILGWIISKVLNFAEDVIGYVIGSILDIAMTTVFTFLINTFGRILADVLVNNDFEVLKLPQQKLYDLIGLQVSSAELASIFNGREGELELRANFGSPLPITSAPYTYDFQPKPATSTLPFSSALDNLPVYAIGDFNPSYRLPQPNLSTLTASYTIATTADGAAVNVIMTLNILKNSSGLWTLIKSMTGTVGSVSTTDTSTVLYSPALQPQSVEHTVTQQTSSAEGDPGQNVSYTYKTAVDYTASKIDCSSVLNSYDPSKMQIDLPAALATNLETLELWFIRLSYSNLQPGDKGKFARIAISSSYLYNNWLRVVPVTISSVENTILYSDPTISQSVTGLKVKGADEDGSFELLIFKTGGLYSASFTTADSLVTIKKI